MQPRRVFIGENHARICFIWQRRSRPIYWNFRGRPIIGVQRSSWWASRRIPPKRDIQHHDTSIHYDFEDSFPQKKSARSENFKFFKLISLTILACRRNKSMIYHWATWIVMKIFETNQGRRIKFFLTEFAYNYCSKNWIYRLINRSINPIRLQSA